MLNCDTIFGYYSDWRNSKSRPWLGWKRSFIRFETLTCRNCRIYNVDTITQFLREVRLVNEWNASNLHRITRPSQQQAPNPFAITSLMKMFLNALWIFNDLDIMNAFRIYLERFSERVCDPGAPQCGLHTLVQKKKEGSTCSFMKFTRLNL